MYIFAMESPSKTMMWVVNLVDEPESWLISNLAPVSRLRLEIIIQKEINDYHQ
jgi:hypothetical protein